MNANKIFGFLCTFLRSAGLWKPYNKSQFIQRIYTVYGGFFLLFTIAYTIPLAASIFLVDSVNDIPSRLFMSSTKLAMINKLIPIVLYNESIQQIRTLIDGFAIKTFSEHRLAGIRFNVFAKIMYIFFAMPHISISVWNIATVLSDQQRLTFDGWYPGFDWENNSRDYWIIYFYQYIGISVTGCVNITIDLFYCFAMYAISVEFEILGNRLSLIRSENSPIVTKKHIIEHIKTLIDIRHLTDIVKGLLNTSYFSQVVFSAIVIFATTEEMAKVKQNDIFIHFRYFGNLTLAIFRQLWMGIYFYLLATLWH